MTEHKLPVKTLVLWEIRLFLLSVLFLALFSFYFRGFSWCFKATTVIAFVLLLVLVWYLPNLFKSYNVRYISGAVIIERGVIVKTVHVMPFSKLIYAKDITTPLSKLFGIAAISLKAARSSLLIPEISETQAAEFIKKLAEGEIDEKDL